MAQKSFQRSKKRFRFSAGARRAIFREERQAADLNLAKGTKLVAKHTKTAWKWVVVRTKKPTKRRK